MGEAPQRKRISLELPAELLEQLDVLKGEWGLRSRGDLLVRLLRTVLPTAAPADGLPDPIPAEQGPGRFDEGSALVLVKGQGQGELFADTDRPWAVREEGARRDGAKPAKAGIDLPGFVRRQSAQLKRSLQPRSAGEDVHELLPAVSADQVRSSLASAAEHWHELYGSAPNEAVLEAAMVWLAQDIWPHFDQGEGRPFTWSLALDVVGGFAPALGDGPASFERVMVVAGLLEDPFSAATLDLRVPTLIRRFVHRFRRRQQGTSFQTLEHTMTLHGALKILQLPTAPGARLTLREIRDAYRQMAMGAHPDGGGSSESMRRLNEAYQLLKELYRTTD
ncbi:MAG: molecular chaperone DnaJ [Cyanobacteriota bacterium]|nr:molecular chaperone DnaJ [Cyanobacteriota bacterium]